MRLKDKYAVITGGAGGIGLASARSFLEEGAAGVLLVDLQEEGLRKAAAYRFFLCKFFYFFEDITPQPSGKGLERYLLSMR